MGGHPRFLAIFENPDQVPIKRHRICRFRIGQTAPAPFAHQTKVGWCPQGNYEDARLSPNHFRPIIFMEETQPCWYWVEKSVNGF